MADHTLNVSPLLLKTGEFQINGQSMLNKRIYLSSPPQISNPKLKIDRYEVLGRDGYVELSHDTLGSRECKLHVSILASTISQIEETKSFINELIFKQISLRFYDEPFGYYVGRVVNIDYKKLRVNTLSKFAELELVLQPRRVLKRELKQIANGDRFTFSKGILSPIIKITGNGDFSITLDKTFQFRNVANNGPVVLDCINRTFTQQTPTGRVNVNHVKFTKGYPTIKSGVPITWSGNISKVEIDYEWQVI